MMVDYDDDWARRHVAAFRFHRGHDACTVNGCTGSQPLMWVPTADEDGEVAALEAEVIVMAEQARIVLGGRARRRPDRWSWGAGHIYWEI